MRGVLPSSLRLRLHERARKSGSPAEGNYPSMKIASSRALSSWNCRSMSAPSSWKSGTSSSAGAQYPETISRRCASLFLSFSRIRSRARAFLYTFTKLRDGSFGNGTGAWHVATRHLFCHACTLARTAASPKKQRILF